MTPLDIIFLVVDRKKTDDWERHWVNSVGSKTEPMRITLRTLASILPHGLPQLGNSDAFDWQLMYLTITL